MKKSYVKISTWLLLFYSFFAKFCLSLASPIFPMLCIQPDNTVFYNVGRGIMNGLTLYKDMVDFKTPYIHFINGFASLISYRHIGLYIVESIVLFFTLYATYKIALLFVESKVQAFLCTVLVQCLLTIPSIIFGVSSTECYCLPFILYASFMAINYFINGKSITKKDSFIFGLLLGFSGMINQKTATFFVGLYVVVLIRMIARKEKFFDKILFVISGGFISILPYLVYMVVTDSVSDAIHCIFTLSMGYINSHVIVLMFLFVKYYTMFFICIFISLVILIFKCKNFWVKISYILTFLIVLFSVSITNHPYSYYLAIFYPYFIPLFIFIVKALSKIFKRENLYYILLSALIIIINIVTVYPATKNSYERKAKFYTELRKVVSEYVDDVSNKKVLALAFNPDIYMALDVLPSFPCFVTVNNTYEALPNLFNQQAKYIEKSLPDIVTINRVGTYFYFPSPIRDEMEKKLSKDYIRIEDVESNYNNEIFEIYIKNGVS